MRFIGTVLRDAARLLAAAPPDLMLAVAGVFVLGALLTITATSPLLGLMLDFLGSTLLGAGLVGRPAPDRLAPAASRLGRRLSPAVAQLLVVILVFLAVILLSAVVAGTALAVFAPDLAERLSSMAVSREAVAGDPTFLLVALPFLVLFLVLAGRLLPSAGLVLDQPVGGVESLRMAWASTRGRTLACAALLLLTTAPNWLLVAFLPPTMSVFLTILSVVFSVAVGVAAYRQLFDQSGALRAPETPTATDAR
jgi:hypothetical protein